MLENEVMNEEEVEATEMDNEVKDSKVEEPQNEQESVHLINKGEAAAFALGAAAAGVALWKAVKRQCTGLAIRLIQMEARLRLVLRRSKLNWKLS